MNYSIEDLDGGEQKSGRHYIDLEPRDYINLNYAQMGVGGDNSWGAKPHEKYMIKPRDYEYSFFISAVK